MADPRGFLKTTERKTAERRPVPVRTKRSLWHGKDSGLLAPGPAHLAAGPPPSDRFPIGHSPA